MKNEIFEEIKRLENEIKVLKEKFIFVHDYKLIAAAFDKVGIINVEFTFDEVQNNDSLYIVECDENEKKFRIKKKVEDEI